jgi:HEPN domain-containing protein
MTPTTARDWISVANERAKDANAMKIERGESAGSVYMAGYALECSLKALLQSKGVSFPRQGQEGHNLRKLWEMSGFKCSDLADKTGAKIFFIEKWNTSLRYELTCDSNLSIAELVDGAKQLTGWIQSQIRRTNRRGK